MGNWGVMESDNCGLRIADCGLNETRAPYGECLADGHVRPTMRMSPPMGFTGKISS